MVATDTVTVMDTDAMAPVMGMDPAIATTETRRWRQAFGLTSGRSDVPDRTISEEIPEIPVEPVGSNPPGLTSLSRMGIGSPQPDRPDWPPKTIRVIFTQQG